MENENVSSQAFNLPGSVKFILAADIIFCLLAILRLIIILSNRVQSQELSLFNLLDLEMCIIYSIAITGNIIILSKKSSGIKLAYINITGTGVDIIIYCIMSFSWIITLKLDALSYGIAIGVGGDILIILSKSFFLIFYWKSISKAKAFFMERAKSFKI